MKSQRHDRISDLFLKACDLEPGERQAFLGKACADDPRLQVEVESLLAYDGAASRVFDSGAGGAYVAAILDDRAETAKAAEEPPPIPGHRILRLLGKGGMAQVYLAEDITLGRQVAVKAISARLAPETIVAQRFVREARTMADVEHPNIVRVYSFGHTEGRYYLIMEYIEGESVAARIRRLGELDVDLSLRILSQAVEALDAAWKHGVVHRDVKPANMLIDARDQVRVTDFGLAKVSARPDEPSLSQLGSWLGTPHYISPEQARGEETVDFRADIYSLGIVLYEMLTGRPPFRGATTLSVVDQHLHAPLPAVRFSRPEASGELEQLCEWMTRKRPGDRPRSYEELRQTVDTLVGRAPSSGGTPRPLPASLSCGEDEEAGPAFVGRQAELRELSGYLDRTLNGCGQVVFVVGEAGCGKTALISEFTRQARQRHPDLIVARGHSDAQTGAGDPYLPFREVLGLLTGDVKPRLASGAIARDHAGRLWNLVPAAVRALLDTGPDLVDTFVAGEPLVGRAAAFTPIPVDWRVRLEELVRRHAGTPRDVSLHQSNLFEQYTRTLHLLAREHPLILELEDLHWSDSGSCGLLFHLGRNLAGSRILVVCTYRPTEIESTRAGQPHPLNSIVNEFRLQFGELEIELGEEGTREFTDALLDYEPNKLGAGFRDAFFRRTRAHPLFAVELLRSMREHDMLLKNATGMWVEGTTLDWETLPARVEGAIRARIGPVPEALSALLGLASVQGEDFTAEVLARVQRTDEREMVRLLSTELDKRHHLIRAKGIRPRDGRHTSTYRFRHILFQKYLYDQLDEVERAYLHEDVGKALEAIYGDRVDEVAVQLARHFHEAGIASKTVQYLRLAGDRAVRLSANEEAIAHFTRALGLLERLPAGPETDREELALQLALGAPLLGTAGPGSPHLSRAYTRARELCDQVGEASQLFQTLFILVHHHANRGDMHTALELAEQLVQAADSIGEAAPAVMAYWARGFARHYLGRFDQARGDHERVIELYDPKEHSSLAYIYGMDPAVSALSYNSVAAWCLGYSGQARDYGRRALGYARKLDHPCSLAHALTQSNILAMFARDLDALRERSESLLRVSTDKGVVLFRAWGTIARGWIRVEEGRPEEGADLLREGLAATHAAGSRLSHPVVLAKLAEACRKTGRGEEGTRLLSDATSAAQTTGEYQFEAELHRLQGESLLSRGESGASTNAEACFRQAIEVARRQKARSWELRATTSLYRMARPEGKSEEARHMLAEVHAWFREGFETSDLKDAAALLEELS